MGDQDELCWRPMARRDLVAVSALAAAIHVDHPEDDAVLAERLRLAPEGCFVLGNGDHVAGYALSHPARLGHPPALDTLLGQIPGDADNWYLHDVALTLAARGKGHVGVLVDHLDALARSSGFTTLGLIAVAGTLAFWTRRGFVAHDDPALAATLASYDAEACYMIRRVETIP